MFPSFPHIMKFNIDKIARYHLEADTARALRHARDHRPARSSAPARKLGRHSWVTKATKGSVRGGGHRGSKFVSQTQWPSNLN